MTSKLKIFTDGSCLDNPGPGGYAYVYVKNNVVLTEHSNHCESTTNNQMELKAAIEAVKKLKDNLSLAISDDEEIELNTDSMYVKKGITEWIQTWKENNWKRKGGPVKNIELWKELDNLVQSCSYKIEWNWVKAHADNKWNNHVDSLAFASATRAKVKKTEQNLTVSQKKALECILSGKNVFITGQGGCGKTHLINYFVKHYKTGKNIAVTSTTGTSALHIHGTTLHSWGGIGLGKGSVSSIVTKIKKKSYLKDRWLNVKILIIDEISMLSPELFDKLEKIAKMVRKSTKPFGGIQLVLTGDFCQLPCVDSEKFCFEAETWNICVNKIICMTENLRQKDLEWQTCLSEIRMGELSKATKSILKKCARRKVKSLKGIIPTMLFPLNADVETINNQYLEKLCEQNGEVNDYEMEVDLYNKKNIQKLAKFKKDCPAMETLSLTTGCQVMLLWNLDLEQGLVNGSRGIVVKFINDLPLVKFLDGQTRLIDYHTWEYEEEDKKIASIEQLPLKLAWAYSIHKSQGCSLDYVVTDLENIFEYGQAYVALSRVRKSSGLFIKNLRFSKIKTDPYAKRFYQNLE